MAADNPLIQDAKQPHMGAMVEKIINEKGVFNTEVARQMGRAHTSIARYKLEPSLQGRILWKLGLVLRHNFFADLSAQFPIQVIPAEHLQECAALNDVIKAKDQQIRDLEKELAIYKEIVLRK